MVKKKAGNPSKRKGGRFENMVYRDLKTLIPDIKKSLGSGNSVDEKADLVSIKEKMLFELKHYKVIREADIKKWWLKLLKDRETVSKELDCYVDPYLIMKSNHQPIMIVFNYLGKLPARMLYSDWKIVYSTHKI